MESRNVAIIGVWAFVIIWLVGMLYLKADLFIALILFFIAIVFSVVVLAMKDESKELDKIRSRIDSLSKEVEEIKKVRNSVPANSNGD